ncbi:hypothetical protein [Nocardia aurantiaca]|uniref:Lipoprotein n=1 Tax=Nocardia aurantiaca TaxID=2675850 RepID=A0A6I3L3M2_9NOCA|nr:hypothetical protein [Nocardia aurantiaca]MTE16181.1 hypothetical protein [Nocardia aurantiaca]
MRTTANIAGAALIMATAFTLSACNDTAATGASASSAHPTPGTPTAAFPAAGHEAIHCGTGPWGLAVVVSTAKGNDFCPTAISVVTAYADERAEQSTGDIAVTIDTVRWVCGERRSAPGSYQECSSQNESADKIRLQS